MIRALATLTLAVVLAPACGGGGGGGGGTPAPIDLQPLAGPVHHEVDLVLALQGPSGGTVDARVELTMDGGRTTRPLQVDPPGPYSIEEGAPPVPVVWDSMSELGAGVHQAHLRARSVPDGMVGPWRPITVANYEFADADDIADWANRGEDPQELVLADAWSFTNWANGHLEGAVSLPVDRILAEGEAALPYPRDRRLVFYCGGGT